MNKSLLKYVILSVAITILFGAQIGIAGVAPASVFDIAEQYRPDKIRNALKNETAGTPLSDQEKMLLKDYHADEKQYRELKSKTECVCSESELATSYKYAEDPLPDCKTIPQNLLKQALYIDANGSHYLVSPEDRAKMEKKMQELNLKWSE